MKNGLPSSVAAARRMHLRYVTDAAAGLRREPDARSASGFRYRNAAGRLVSDEATLARIKALAIPPAWNDVWICALANGHIQATGRDARGRKQYRYHPCWRSARDETKYERMLEFGEALPGIRSAVDAALKLPGVPRDKVLAIAVHLLQLTTIRVGNEEYARSNQSFGLTTLRDRHVRVRGGAVELRFRGKSGIAHAVRINDKKLARIIARMRDLPGQELFQYLDDDGNVCSLGSADVNEYLKQISGKDFTAKDFRTWSGTVLAAAALHDIAAVTSNGDTPAESAAKKHVVQAVAAVAEQLRNTPAVCRKCYIHPMIIDSYLDGSLPRLVQAHLQTTAPGRDRARSLRNGNTTATWAAELSPPERAVLALLRQRYGN